MSLEHRLQILLDDERHRRSPSVPGLVHIVPDAAGVAGLLAA